LFAQDASNPEWLPKTLADSYAEALSAATDYVLTREGCARLIEAKLSESSNLGDPKFILTCADSSGVTANFVIWQRDIDNNFSDNRYREKSQDKNLTLILSPVEAQRKLQLENSGLIDQCKDQLQTLLESREIVMAESDIHLSQRGEQPVSVNFNYQVGAGDYAPKFSAICRRDSFNDLNLQTFSRQ